MSRRSVKEDKSIYQVYREEAGMTRLKASEELFISDSRVERIEYGSMPQPDEVMMMSKVYRKPELCNYYCTHECEIGREKISEIKPADLPAIVLEIINSLNILSNNKDRLVEIAVDGIIEKSEVEDFLKIKDKLNSLSGTVESLKLWIDKAIANGEFGEDSHK